MRVPIRGHHRWLLTGVSASTGRRRWPVALPQWKAKGGLRQVPDVVSSGHPVRWPSAHCREAGGNRQHPGSGSPNHELAEELLALSTAEVMGTHSQHGQGRADRSSSSKNGAVSKCTCRHAAHNRNISAGASGILEGVGCTATHLSS